MLDAPASNLPATADAAPPARSSSRTRLDLLLADRAAVAGLIVIAMVALLAVIAPYIAADPIEQNIAQALQPPSAQYWFGTDEFGRDVFSRVLHGARPALFVGILSVAVSMVIGIPLGMIAGLRGGWIDAGISGLVDIMLSFPGLLLALMIVALVGSGLGTLVLAIGVAHVPIFVRLARSSTLLIRELDYVAACRSFGGGDRQILLRHILPNVIGPLIVMATLSIAGAIREEAGLSFLGLGVQPPQASWGNLIRDGVATILEAPWLAIIPGLYLTVSVLAFNILGDSVRNILDPRDLASAAAKKGN